jgi:membrane peptidoglycan carboxypeptidase
VKSASVPLAPGGTTATRPARRRTLNAVALAVAVGVTGCAIAATAVYASLPSVNDAPARVQAIVRSQGGIATYVAPQARVARATVAIEDRRFFEHGAVDPVSIARVLVGSVLHPGVDQGGATIAQQLAKVLYNEPSSVLGGLKSIGLAFKLEQRYSKARILSMYLNSVYFGHGFWGVARASEGYFGRPVTKLSWSQAALLAGLPQAPSLLDPLRHPAAARLRRLAVLRELARSGALTSSRAAELARAPLFGPKAASASVR